MNDMNYYVLVKLDRIVPKSWGKNLPRCGKFNFEKGENVMRAHCVPKKKDRTAVGFQAQEKDETLWPATCILIDSHHHDNNIVSRKTAHTALADSRLKKPEKAAKIKWKAEHFYRTVHRILDNLELHGFADFEPPFTVSLWGIEGYEIKKAFMRSN